MISLLWAELISAHVHAVHRKLQNTRVITAICISTMLHNLRHVHSFDEVVVATESRQQYTMCTLLCTGRGREGSKLAITQIHRLHLYIQNLTARRAALRLAQPRMLWSIRQNTQDAFRISLKEIHIHIYFSCNVIAHSTYILQIAGPQKLRVRMSLRRLMICHRFHVGLN